MKLIVALILCIVPLSSLADGEVCRYDPNDEADAEYFKMQLCKLTNLVTEMSTKIDKLSERPPTPSPPPTIPDPCGHGFQYIGERCYKLHLTSKVTWTQAKNSCAQEHARLAVIRLRSQINALTPYLSAANAKLVHVGFKKDTAGVWRYVDSRQVNNELWGRNQPSGDGTCGNLLNAHTWDRYWIGWKLNDERCGTKIGFICQR